MTASDTQDETLAWLALTLVPGVTRRMQRSLLAVFGSPQAVISTPPPQLGAVVGAEAAAALSRGPDSRLVDATLSWVAESGHSLLTLADEGYPQGLLQAADPPTVLYVQGRRELLNAPAMAIVGSRNATPQGSRDATAFARALSDAGLCIVSGLALGIDAAAHRGGLQGKSSTIAVMATGADRVYPAAHRTLAHEIVAAGCVISEFPVGTAAHTGNFPQRNRLISGLARGVLVVEAALKSGSLITARLAAEQGRDVFAIPGSIHSALSKGCHELIRQGAKLVESADDILVEFHMRSSPRAVPPRVSADPVLQQMGAAPISFDQLAERMCLAAADLSAQLSRLELDGDIAVLPGGWFQRVERAR